MRQLEVFQVQNQTPPRGFGRVLNYLKKSSLRCLLIAVFGFAVHFPALQGEFVWDDDYLIRTNAFIKSPVLTLEAFRHHLFPESYSVHYRPVQNLSYMADYLVWNSNFYGFHLSSILFHVGSGILLFLLLQKLLAPLLRQFRKNPAEENAETASWLAFFIALLWVVHPVHSAAVDYVSGRADSLAFFFACGGWLLFLKARELQRRVFRYVLFSLAWFSGMLGLCSRESACLWLIIFLVYLFSFEKRTGLWQKWVVTAACILLLAGYIGLRHLPAGRPITGPSSDWSPSLRAVLMLRALGDYGRLMVYPGNLHMERTVYNPAAYNSETLRWRSIELEYLSIAGLIVIAAFCGLATRKGVGQGARIFGGLWFFLAYLPISNLIDLNATVAEHWLYLPSVGFLIFIAGCAVDLPRNWRRATVPLACAAILGLSVRSAIRSSDWASNETFARRTLAAGGTSVRIGLLLAQVYSNRGDYVAAESILRKALLLCPDYPIARNNLADALFHEGKVKEAEELFAGGAKAAHEEMKEYPRTWIAAANLAHMRETQHDLAGAVDILEKARHDYPETWELVSLESELLRQEKKLDDSSALLRGFTQNNWWHYRACMALGRVLAQKGDSAGAEAALSQASWLDVHETDALNLLAFIRVQQNRLEDACRTQRRAVARQPDQPRQYLLLSDILEKMGRNDEAHAVLAEVSRLKTLADSQKAAN